MRKNIKLKLKHEKLINHFMQFVDRRWYTDYIPTKEDKKNFIHFQSYGPKELMEYELKSLEPLINAQELKELTIKMMVEDIGLFWSKGWGWYTILSADIEHNFKTRHVTKDVLFTRALIKIAKNIQTNGIINFLQSFTGLSKEWKNQIFTNWCVDNPKA